ncbi:SusC/RagA family TonB-linked outer membrane protein [Chitinophaga lutea]|nr:SusC/RagA family TonB-linked outer membrane protein [Chitinophaga lutea]
MTYFYPSSGKGATLLLGLLMLGAGATAQQKLYKKSDSTASAGNSEADQRLRGIAVQARDTIGYIPHSELLLRTGGAVSRVHMDEVRKLPYTSVNQMLLGRATGVDVRIPTNEPGKRSAAFVRGASGLLLKNGDLFGAQPVYMVDGMPLITDHSFAYDVQRFDFNRMGTEIDPLVFLNVNDIQRIEVLKDFGAAAKYGPLASNGVINIVTRGPRSGELQVEVNGYAGMSLKPAVNVINGRWERDFRLPFYDRYASREQYRSFPSYLADSTNSTYYGRADWDESYYRNGWNTGLQAAVSGGNRLASFRFSVGQASEQGVAEKTGLRRYNVNFGINVMPMRNLLWSTFISAAVANRDRAQTIRDRMGDEDYIFNLEKPPSSNKAGVDQYFRYLEKGIDKNRNASIRVLNTLQYTVGRYVKINSRFGIDHGQNYRDLFIPTTVSDGNNFVSNYDGLHRRLVFDNSVEITPLQAKGHQLSVTLGQNNQWDMWKYNYGRAYKGKSDYIQIYQPGNNDNKPGASHNLRLTANYRDRVKNNLASFYADIDYSLAGKYFFELYLRQDGSSNVSEAERWKLFPTLAAAWKISGEDFMKDSRVFSNLRLRASAGRVGKMFQDDYYKGGPVYNVEAGWEGSPNMPTYDAFPVLNAAYELGYISEGIGWAYTDQLNGGLDIGLLNDRLQVSLDVYTRQDKQLLIKMPAVAESGYSGIWKNGMDIANYGGELGIEANILNGKKFSWTTMLSASANKTKLLRLPDGKTDVRLGNRRFVVGKPVDKYWLLINDGIYQTDSEVPAGMTYQGLPMKAGDPKWRDVNGDNDINDNDRVITGTHNPAVQGGWGNTLRYGKLELNMLFSYAFGRKLLNKALADRFDFANNEGVDEIDGAKEFTYWTRPDGDLEAMPRYNPWSPVRAYQVEQTLFLEKASYVKLRSLSLTYNFAGPWMERNGLRQLRVFVTGNNLFTLTDYSGGDPEAFDYFGYDQGMYNWAQPKSFTLGFNLLFK